MNDKRRQIGLFSGWMALVILGGCFGGKPAYRAESSVRAETLLERALRAEGKNDRQEAEKLLGQAFSAGAAIEDLPLLARIGINQARLSRLQSDLPKASRAIDRVLSRLEPEEALFSEAAHEKALLELAGGNAQAARPWAERAVSAEKGSGLGGRLNLLARIQLALGDDEGAESSLKRALDLNRAAEHAEEVGNTLRMQAVLSRKRGNNGEAARLLTEALRIDKLTGRSSKIAADLEELAITARALNDLKKAADFLERAGEVNYNAGRHQRAAQNLAAAAEVYRLMGDADKAAKAEVISREHAEKGGGKPDAQATGISPVTTSPSKSP